MDSFYARGAGVILASAYFIYYACTPTEWHFIDNVNLIFHEAGHTIFIFFGQYIHVLMGSGFQVLLPLLIAGYFYYTGQKLSAAVSLMWVGQNLINVSVYAGDAIVMQLPLLGGDNGFHDWHYLLGETGMLAYTPLVANTLYGLGCAVIALGIILAFIFLYRTKETVLN